MKNRYRLINFNFKLFLFTMALAVIGIFAVGSAEESLQYRQLGGVIAGFVIMMVMAYINYHLYMNIYIILYIINLVLLLMVKLFGQSENGAQRWITLMGVRFQPSEVCKVLLIVCLAAFIYKHYEDINTFKFLLFIIILFSVPVALVYIQPDMSTTIVIGMIFICIMFVSGTSWKIILGTLAIALPAILIMGYLIMQPDQDIISDYQKNRILSFFNKEETANNEGYQQTYSVMAIGSGQLTGKGYRNNETYSVKNADFLAEQQTDFIYAVIGEEAGFIGAGIVILLLFLISFECFLVAYKASDIGGKVIATGVGAWIGFQGFINIGVVTYLLPNTGLPLPFVSYGLTSLISTFAGIGLVLNVGLQCNEK